jgi:hypothetical protein
MTPISLKSRSQDPFESENQSGKSNATFQADGHPTARSEADEIRYLLQNELKLMENPAFTFPRPMTPISSRNSLANGIFNSSYSPEPDSAASYARKCAQLRDEYETYIQRIMIKLLEEQQNRTTIENKLEDAMVGFVSLSDLLK